MCVILDTCYLTQVLAAPRRADAKVILGWLKRSGSAVYGGELRREATRNGAIFRFVRDLRRAGRYQAVSDEAVDAEAKPCISG